MKDGDSSDRRTQMLVDMQPERLTPRVADLPARWRDPSKSGVVREVYGWAADELSAAIANDPTITLGADAIEALAKSRDVERRCAQLQREVEVYRRALAQIISVHALEGP